MNPSLQLSFQRNMTISVIAAEPGPVSTSYPTIAPGMKVLDPKIVATHSFADAPDVDILLVPGGTGDWLLDENKDRSIEDFVAARYPRLEYLLSVCTGAASLAKAGVLKGRKATTNKAAWDWVTSRAEGVDWVPTARWVADGKIWTSSGVSAGMDMMYAFLKHFYGDDDEVLARVMNGIEYAPHTNADWDPFSVVFKVCRCVFPAMGSLFVVLTESM